MRSAGRGAAGLLLGVAAASAAPGLLLRDVHVPGIGPAPARRGVDLRVAAGRIADLGPGLAPRAGERVLDLRGASVIAGLWDSHVHLVPGLERDFLAAGVTTVVDLGNAAPVPATRGLHVLRAGRPLEGPGPVWEGVSEVLPGPEGLAAAVHARRAAGARALKAYGSFPPAWLPGLRAVAGGAPVLADLVAPLGRVLEVLGVALAHAPDPQGGAAALAAALAAEGRVIVSTFRAFRDAGRMGGSHPALDARWRGGGAAGFDRGDLANLRRRGARMERFLRAYAATGAPGLLVGTDTGPGVPGQLPGAGLVDELLALRALGFPPAVLLEAATLRPARVFGARDRGVVAPGAVADLVVLPGDPTRDLAVLRRPRLVLAAGRAVLPR